MQCMLCNNGHTIGYRICKYKHKVYDINTFQMQRVSIHTVESIQSYTYRLVTIKSIHSIQAM